MWSSHGTVIDYRNVELKTKKCQNRKRDPTTWTTEHEPRAVDLPCRVTVGQRSEDRKRLQGKMRCEQILWTDKTDRVKMVQCNASAVVTA